MKRIILFLIGVLLFSFNIFVNAECNDDELNEWATKVEGVFTKTTESQSNKYGFAYFLSITPQRDDIEIFVSDSKGNFAEAIMYEDDGIFGVGATTNLEEETYSLDVYGGENSACPNELLKSVKIVVPRFNRMIKDERCLKYPEHELCQTYTNATENMSYDEFDSIMTEYDKTISKENSPLNKMFVYLIYLIVPFALVTIIYVLKIRKYKKEVQTK